MSILDFKVLEYRPTGNMVVADATLKRMQAAVGRETLK